MNQQDQSRKEFEIWARERGYQCDELARCSIGIVGPEYFNLNTENAWQAWQAARVPLEAMTKDAARYRVFRANEDGVSVACTWNGNTGATPYINGKELDDCADSWIAIEEKNSFKS